MGISIKKSFVLSVAVFLAVGSFFASRHAEATMFGEEITGLDVPDNVLQLGETETRTATTTEEGASDWTSSATSTAEIDSTTGVVTVIAAGTTTIAYATSTSGRLNSTLITVYAAAEIDPPAIGTVRVGGEDVTPTSFTEPETGTSTIGWLSSDTGVATIDALTGAIRPVSEGTTTISYRVTETATGRIVAKGSLEITVEAAPTLSSIEITTPANTLSYTVGDELDITGMVVTGTYSDSSTSTEDVAADDVMGFDSSAPEANQLLTVTVGGKTATYTVDINAIPLTAIGAITGTPQFGVELTAGAVSPEGATVTYQWLTSASFDGTYTNIGGATLSTYTPDADDVTKYLKVAATGTGNYSGTLTSAATELGVAAVPLTAIGAITGTPKYGLELTAGAVSPSGATVTYQWQRATSSDGTYRDISGATASTYEPGSNDVAKYIKVAATGTGAYSGTVTSAATTAVADRSHNSGGGGGSFMRPASLTTEQLQAAVNSLIAQINALIAQAKARGIQLPPGISESGGNASSIVLSAIVRPLLFGAAGDDVKALQNFLISQNKGPAAENLKRNGATTFFGLLTKAALAEFQGSAGLPATGYFGPLTKAYLKTLGF